MTKEELKIKVDQFINYYENNHYMMIFIEGEYDALLELQTKLDTLDVEIGKEELISHYCNLHTYVANNRLKLSPSMTRNYQKFTDTIENNYAS